jgi:YD repeat-containing protein
VRSIREANTTIYGYDAKGNAITLQDANTHTSQQNFDLLGELTNKTLPDGSLTESRQYDNNGNLTSLTHFNGVTTTYTYDNLNRLLSRATPNEPAVSFNLHGNRQAPYHGRCQLDDDAQLRQHGPADVETDSGRNAELHIRCSGPCGVDLVLEC